jgi:Glycosyltransferase 61
MDVEVRSFDDALRQVVGAAVTGSGHAPPSNLAFQQQGAFDFRLKPDIFLNASAVNDDVRKKIELAAERTRGLPVGIVTLNDVHIVGPSGLIVDLNNRICWKGWLLNWTDLTFGAHLNNLYKLAPDSAHFPVHERVLAAKKRMPNANLIAAAGYNVYGHWLLDYLPRINRLLGSEYEAHPVYRKTLRNWSGALGALFAPRLMRPANLFAAPAVHVEQLIVPTTGRAFGVLEENSMRETWDRLNAALALDTAARVPVSAPEKIFVSRRNVDKELRPNRKIHNIDAMERRAARAGFTVVHPEAYSFAEQRLLFSAARVVVGEDGSGLHNSIFSQPGARIGIISTSRHNTLHAMIANIRDLHVTYIASKEVKTPDGARGGFRVEPAEFDQAIEMLVS